MVSLDDHTHTTRLQHLHQGIGHLVGEALLHLQPAGKHLDHAGNLRQAHEPAVRQVRHVRLAEERQQVMLAQRVDLDVAHADEILVPLPIQRVTDDVGDGHVVATREPLERRLHPGRSLAQALADGIFTGLHEHLAHQRLECQAPFPGGHRGERRGVLRVEAVQAGGLHFVASHACWASGAGLSSAHVKLKVLAFLSTAGGSALSALWTFPSILASAFLVAWGAEAAQFLISQGLALAILAWLQTLPEFAVEAVIAWDAGREPERAHLAIANLTGAIRLLLGLGWPMIYFVFAVSGRKRAAGGAQHAAPLLPAIRLEREHAVEIVGLVPPLLYFGVILFKQSITWVDSVVLLTLYIVYLGVLFRNAPHGADRVADAPAVSRWAYRQPGWRRPLAIAALFGGGGALLYVTAHPFLESMLAVAGLLGVSQFVLVQWVAPFLSEFPEKVSAFYWARRVSRAPMALMNMVSSNINQWTVLAAMIPLIYGYSSLRHHGVWLDFHFDEAQRLEILLTLLQTGLGVLLLANMEFDWLDASIIFVLWLAQFLRPDWREEVAVAYGLWMVILGIGFVVRGKPLLAPKYFWETLKARSAGTA